MFAEIVVTADIEIELARHVIARDGGMVAIHRRGAGRGAGVPKAADHALAEPAFIDEEAPIIGVIPLIEEYLPMGRVAVVGARRFHDGGTRYSRVGDELGHIGG